MTGGARLATLDGSEGIGMGEIDDRTVAGLTATLVRAFEVRDAALAAGLPFRRQSRGAWQWSLDMWNSDAG